LNLEIVRLFLKKSLHSITKNNLCVKQLRCLLQSVENRCGWSEKCNQDAMEELRETLKGKEKVIEVKKGGIFTLANSYVGFSVL
jgi:hypothetical protein